MRHAHVWGQLAFASSGVMRVATDAATWLVPPTKAIWIPAGLPHQILFGGEAAMRTLSRQFEVTPGRYLAD